MAEPLALRGVIRTYRSDAGALPVLRGVDLCLNAGEIVALVAPSGTGKSTLLHLAGLLEKPDGGKVIVNGRDSGELSDQDRTAIRRDAIGFVYQFHHLLPEFTAQENVELPALLAGHSPNQARARATALLDQVGLADRARHLPSMLSGGQRQRVAIARALVNDPEIVLADEPTGNLDSASAFDVLSLLGDLHAKGLTLVIVTHDERIAATADRLISMRDGAFIDETRLTGGSRGHLSTFAEWEHLG